MNLLKQKIELSCGKTSPDLIFIKSGIKGFHLPSEVNICPKNSITKQNTSNLFYRRRRQSSTINIFPVKMLREEYHNK